MTLTDTGGVSENDDNIGAIVGGIVGGIVAAILLILIIILLVYCCMKNREKSSRQSKEHVYTNVREYIFIIIVYKL